MQMHWTDIELKEQWSLTETEQQALFPGRKDVQRLAVAALLKFYQISGHFPAVLREIPECALHYLSGTLGCDAHVSPSHVYALPTRTYECGGRARNVQNSR